VAECRRTRKFVASLNGAQDLRDRRFAIDMFDCTARLA
jgi:hypothetical protein